MIHGGGDVGWYWHLVEAELQQRGHDVVSPDLPGDDDSAELTDYADFVVAAAGDRKVIVGQSFGGFTAPLVADRLRADVLVLVAGMIPSPGEPPGDWWKNTGYQEAVQEQAARDGGLTGNDDPYVSFYHDVPRELAEEALSKERAHPSQAAMAAPWPLDACRTCRRNSSCARRTASSRPTSFAGWSPSVWTSRPTRSQAATVPPSVAPRNSQACWRATRRRRRSGE